MEYATRETQLRETTLRALDSLWTEVKILREWRASVEGRLESLESSSHSQEASSSRDGLVHSPSKETHASSPATDGGQHQASSTESSPPSSLSLSVLPPNSTGILILSHIRSFLCEHSPFHIRYYNSVHARSSRARRGSRRRVSHIFRLREASNQCRIGRFGSHRVASHRCPRRLWLFWWSCYWYILGILSLHY